MTGERKSMTSAPVSMLLFVLLSLALLLFGGCAGSTSQRTSVDPTGTVPSAQGERELLDEIDRKFENPTAHYDLARVYHRSQQWTKAEYHYNVALGFDPAHRAAQASMVKMFIDRGDMAKAEQYANSYIRQASMSVRETLRLAWEFEKVGLNDRALQCFRQAMAAAPDSAEVNKQVGFYYLGKGDNARAKEYLGRSFQADANQADVAGALGRLGVVVQAPVPVEPPAEPKQ